jgi:hypothetical protein
VLTKHLSSGGSGGNLGRFVLRGKAQPVGVLTKQLSRQRWGRGDLGRLVLQGKAQPVGVHTKQLSRQGRGGATSVGFGGDDV